MDNIYDVLRKYEFNKTEPETLQELVKSATTKGSAARDELRKLSAAAQHLAETMLDLGLVTTRPIPSRAVPFPPMVGIDGSCQQVGGFGGRWFVPISCAIIKALAGTITDLDVEVTAGIEELQQKEFQNVAADVSKLMMAVETKAISSWARRAPANSFVFLDGPIIDPPSCKDPVYVNLRYAAIAACQAKGMTVVGCVKSSFDTVFRDYVRKLLPATDTKSDVRASMFPTDTHLLVFVLSALASKSAAPGVYLTSPIPLEDNAVSKLYSQKGLRVVLTYLQKDVGARLLRVECAIPRDLDEAQIPAFLNPVIDLVVATTYPGYYLPLPVQMAHEKCNIRQGCAEVLYDEIMTRSHASGPLEQIVISKLR